FRSVINQTVQRSRALQLSHRPACEHGFRGGVQGEVFAEDGGKTLFSLLIGTGSCHDFHALSSHSTLAERKPSRKPHNSPHRSIAAPLLLAVIEGIEATSARRLRCSVSIPHAVSLIHPWK